MNDCLNFADHEHEFDPVTFRCRICGLDEMQIFLGVSLAMLKRVTLLSPEKRHKNRRAKMRRLWQARVLQPIYDEFIKMEGIAAHTPVWKWL